MKERKLQLLRRKRAAGTTERAHREYVHKVLFAEYDEYLDAHREIAWLADPRIASLLRRSFYHHHGSMYGLLAYCVMPNHVHLLIQPFGIELPDRADDFEVGETKDSASPLATIMHSLKSYTAHEANKILGRSGQFWQHESYDHWVRDDEELERIVAYIVGNPVKASLVVRACEWLWGSAHDRYLHDGDESGWLRWDP